MGVEPNWWVMRKAFKKMHHKFGEVTRDSKDENIFWMQCRNCKRVAAAKVEYNFDSSIKKYDAKGPALGEPCTGFRKPAPKPKGKETS